MEASISRPSLKCISPFDVVFAVPSTGKKQPDLGMPRANQHAQKKNLERASSAIVFMRLYRECKLGVGCSLKTASNDHESHSPMMGGCFQPLPLGNAEAIIITEAATYNGFYSVSRMVQNCWNRQVHVEPRITWLGAPRPYLRAISRAKRRRECANTINTRSGYATAIKGKSA